MSAEDNEKTLQMGRYGETLIVKFVPRPDEEERNTIIKATRKVKEQGAEYWTDELRVSPDRTRQVHLGSGTVALVMEFPMKKFGAYENFEQYVKRVYLPEESDRVFIEASLDPDYLSM
jgi:hypothetical protein